MLILVTGPHGSPGPTSENQVPKYFQLVASAPSAAAQSRLKDEQRQIAKGLCVGTHRTEKNREVTPPTTSYWPPSSLEVREEAPPQIISKGWVQTCR